MAVHMGNDYQPATISIYDRKRDQVYREISLLALDKESGTIVAIGHEAKQLIHHNYDNIVILSPLRNGTVADYILTQKMFFYMLRKALAIKHVIIFKPSILAYVPADTTAVERKALEDALYESGAGKVLVTEKAAFKTDLTGSSPYRVIIEITPNEMGGQIRKEMWREICKDKIPVDVYGTISIHIQGAKTTITLTGQSNAVEIIFDKVVMLNMMEKEVMLDNYNAENEMEKYRKDSFRNVIYQIESRHYVLIGESKVIELMAENDPEICIC